MAELVRLRRAGSYPQEAFAAFNEYAGARAASRAAAPGRAASRTAQPSYAERVRGFAEALEATGAVSPCERQRFRELALAGEGQSVAQGRAEPERQEAFHKSLTKQVRQREPEPEHLDVSAIDFPAGSLLTLLDAFLRPGASSLSLLESGPGHEAFVFCGDEARTVSAELLAQLFAPVLWFSPDEPLLIERQDIPQPLLGDQPPSPAGATRVVYYQVTSGSLLTGRQGPWSGNDQPDLLRHRRLKIRYFFYYSRDTGTNGHPHDVEGVEIFVSVIGWPIGKGGGSGDCVRVLPGLVRGLAHGLIWSANHLLFKGGRGCDAALPITLLVEEGKHASCPDRNGDGQYTPGYDVNVWVNEAWGVRDDFGSERVHSRFHAESAKRRGSPQRVFPPLDHPALVDAADAIRDGYCARIGQPGEGAAAQTKQAHPECRRDWTQSYSLRGAPEAWAVFTGQEQPDEKARGKLQEQEFGVLWKWYDAFWHRGLREYVSIEFAVRDGRWLVLPQLTPFKHGLPLVDGWLTFEPALSFYDKQPELESLGVTYSRSASRPLDWYVKGNFRDFEKLNDGWLPTRFRLRGRAEFGLKIRFQLDQVAGGVPGLKWLVPRIPLIGGSLWNSFLGIRVGVELTPLAGGGHGVRVRWSFGGGAW